MRKFLSAKKLKGITLVELLIVVGIVSVLSLAIIPSYADFSQTKEFNNAAETFVNEVRNVRNKALAGAVIMQSGDPVEVSWGIKPECGTSNYGLGYKEPDDLDLTIQTTESLPSTVKFSASDCPMIAFTRLEGKPEAAGEIILEFKSLARTISINSSGRISYD